MEQYKVSGMTCAACSARVEKAVKNVPGVESCAVSLLTNSMGVEGTAKPEDVIAAVKDAGYGAGIKGDSLGNRGSSPNGDETSELEDTETPKLKKRLTLSVGFLVLLMYVSMGHAMWGFPLPGWFEGNPLAIALIQFILSAIILVINREFFTRGFTGMWHLAPNMDSLVALGSMASFLWSIFILFQMTGQDLPSMMNSLHNLYFESAAMILTLITVGKMLEAKSKGKTTNALKALMKLSPKTGRILRDGKEVMVPVEQVVTGDFFLVKPGENIPVDGEVVEGSSAINESALTGESIPVDKKEGDQVSAGTVNTNGFLKCRATKVGKDTALSQIIQMVTDAAATKAPIAKIADKVAGAFVPVVIAIAVVTTVVWLLVGAETGYALARGISVLVISCPCALGLATPVAIMVGSGVGAKAGILFKTAVSLEETGRVNIVALDKTGTITEGKPVVTDIIPKGGMTEQELLTYGGSLEAKSEHPLAKAILLKQEEKKAASLEVSEFRAVPGNGLEGKIEESLVTGGKLEYISKYAVIDEKTKREAEALADQGKTPMFFAKDGQLIGIIAVADVIKKDSPAAIKELQRMGLEVIMLTGDNERTANAIGKVAGVDQVIAGVLPEGKDRVITKLNRKGKVAMVGDGINDAPALTRASVGIAIGAGTDIAIDAADVVLMKSRLTDAVNAIKLSRATLRNIHENLFWAFFYNIIGIPLAAGAFIYHFGWTLNPMFGAFAMSLSSFCVVTNALRLNRFKIRKPDSK